MHFKERFLSSEQTLSCHPQGTSFTQPLEELPSTWASNMLIFINQIFAKWSRSHVSEQDALRNGTKHRACQRSLGRVQACLLQSYPSKQHSPSPVVDVILFQSFFSPVFYCSELTLSLTQLLLTEFSVTQTFIRISFEPRQGLPKADSGGTSRRGADLPPSPVLGL